MDIKSRLPVMRKPISATTSTAVRAHIPTDRLVTPVQNGHLSKTKSTNDIPSSNFGGRQALTSFESVINSLKNGSTGGGNRPTKRHASPEFRVPRKPMIPAKKLRRSRSVNDLGSILSLAQLQNRSTVKRPAMPPAPSASILKPKLAVSMKAKPTVQKSVRAMAQAPAATQKRNATTVSKKDDSGGAGTATTGAAAAAAAKPKAAAPKKIPAYDFKARFNDLSEKHKILKEKHDRLKQQLGEFESLPEQYDECRAKLNELQLDYKAVQDELSTLKNQNAADQRKIRSLNDELNVKIEECRSVTEAKNAITQQYAAAAAEIDTLKINNTQLETRLKEYSEKLKRQEIEHREMVERQELELREASDQLYRANVDRKDLHNTIMDLRGNIRVFCRVRPPLEDEENRTLCAWQYNDETSLEIASVEINKKPVKHEFSFDQVFAPNSQQQDIFELVSPLVQSALDGYNVCIFAYGQTGSGKTFTMDGTAMMPGIIPHTIDLLFDCFRQNKRLGWQFQLRASALEIYNEVLFDLLSNDAKDLDIRMVSAKTPTEIFVSNLTDVPVGNKEDLHKLMELAKENRATAATVGNERSSRSHSVIQLRLFGEHSVKNESTVSIINLIDLAGSESPKTSVRMDETKKINKSLSELTNVIMALLQKQDHIPYRNSKLTHLLMPSLGGNSKTLMFVNVSPFQDCFVETVKSLRFASSVNSCKMNKAKKNKIYSNPLS